MMYKVKPHEVDVPGEDPFRNDRLDRRQTADALSTLIGTIDGPCVVGLDADWGMGKTTFLQMWREHLRIQGFRVVMFNAWDNDFANEPFLALSEELQGALGVDVNGDDGTTGRLKEAAIGILANAAPAFVRVGATMVAGGLAGDVTEGVVNCAMTLAKQNLTRYGTAKEAMTEFRVALENAVGEQAAPEYVRPPLVVLIDELDRCRPPYAVELLEVLKHLFAVKGVVFVLAVNRSQLEHAVKAMYGAGFDAAVYLRRFFDIDLRLPDQDRDGFIDAQLEAIWAEIHTIHGIGADDWRECGLARDWLKRFFGSPETDLRTIRQALRRLGLVLAMLEGDPNAAMLTATFTLILRTRDRDLYERFVKGATSDDEVAERVLGWTDPSFFTTGSGNNFEASIILAAMECPPDSDGNFDQGRSRLYRKYCKQLRSAPPDEAHNRLVSVLSFVEHHLAHRPRGGSPGPFREAVTRLELVSTGAHTGPD